MNDPSSRGSEYDNQHYHQAATAIMPPGQYKFTPDELRVLQECNNESFLQRSMPLGTILGLGTYVAVQKGHLKPNPRFGAFPKMTLAVVVGYFLGKLSYQQACAEKLMALPGSYIGQVLRDRRDGKISTPPPPKQTTTMFGVSPNDIYSDAGPGNSLDLDTDRPLFNDDSYRPGADVPVINSPDNTPMSPAHSYDDLRRKNRGEYAGARQDPYRMDPNVVPQVTRPRQPQPQPQLQPAPSPSSASTNKYGDVME